MSKIFRGFSKVWLEFFLRLTHFDSIFEEALVCDLGEFAKTNDNRNFWPFIRDFKKKIADVSKLNEFFEYY